MNSVLNVNATMERIDNDRYRLRELYTIALQEFPKWRNRLKESIDSSDLEAIQKTAHSYKGSSATLGAEVLNEMFLDMEDAAKDGNMDRVRKIFTDSFEKNMADLESAIQVFLRSKE
ncbi:MAG: Hpt domain-containing protein [Spirochaetota bacterium]